MRQELLRHLSEAFGPSSLETEVREMLCGELRAAGVPFTTDRAGNLFAHPHCAENAPRVVLFSHMDEAGLMLTDVEDEGFFRFETLGRISARALCGRFILLGNENTRCRGLIAAKGIHLQDREERGRLPKTDDMYIDIGAADKAAAEALLAPGDLGVFDTPFAVFGEEGRFFRGKAFDDRVGCAVLADLAARWHREPLSVDLTVAFLARCEAVPAGAVPALASLAPDVAIAVDAVSADDVGDKPPRAARVGGGAVLPFADGRTLYDRGLHALVREVAGKEKIPFTVPAETRGGADAANLHAAGAGMRCLCLGYPVRYAKTPTSVAAFEDVTALENLLWALVPRLSREN